METPMMQLAAKMREKIDNDHNLSQLCNTSTGDFYFKDYHDASMYSFINVSIKTDEISISENKLTEEFLKDYNAVMTAMEEFEIEIDMVEIDFRSHRAHFIFVMT